ncbi:hypothetical protein AO1008_08278 [Aspergillus oryzae 100-8]|uniref:Protein kinase domain-containing protein n=1 Tax=Aspergillus oryzae (strain 3.042) TaxID=1160506 RepID=I7ZTP6_ASPO3|nr:hypothetical protein Ao3042_08407 [Aspergillus oryzae 3.042]KDE81779.1 hypothetical protein AO1008_08278 [Aspergillus oryzae 100-8]|eukprot:EIT75419.1 hypothetical protein Ao3042_08407 [Aspergillus oryzae 3.042]
MQGNSRSRVNRRISRDLNRFRCETNAYEKLLASGVCERSIVPKFHGCINEVDPAAFHPALRHFAQDTFKPRGILLEYLPNAESLNCVNYSDTLYPQAIEGMKEIHKAGVHHQDIYPRNILLVRGNPDRLVWSDFDVFTRTSYVARDAMKFSTRSTQTTPATSVSLGAGTHNKAIDTLDNDTDGLGGVNLPWVSRR